MALLGTSGSKVLMPETPEPSEKIARGGNPTCSDNQKGLEDVQHEPSILYFC